MARSNNLPPNPDLDALLRPQTPTQPVRPQPNAQMDALLNQPASATASATTVGRDPTITADQQQAVNDALLLQNSISSNLQPYELDNIIKGLGALKARVPVNFQNVISTGIQNATVMRDQVEAAAWLEARNEEASASMTKSVVEGALLANNIFSPAEKSYYNGLASQPRWMVDQVDANGNIVPGGGREVSAQQLRQDFADVKLETLPPDEQARVLNQPPGSPDTPQGVAQQQGRTQNLHGALNRLEGHNAHQTMRRSGNNQSAGRANVQHDHAAFQRAHHAAEDMQRHLIGVQTATNAEDRAMHMGNLRASQRRLAETLQSDIINRLTGGGGALGVDVQVGSGGFSPRASGPATPAGSRNV